METGQSSSNGESSIAMRCQELVVKYGQFTAVDNLDLEIRRGECFGLLGPNGAGKTSTVEVFEGLRKAYSGIVEVLGHRWGGSGDRQLRERLGAALQETQLMELLTVRETIRLFRSFYKNGREIDDVISIFGLGEKRDARVGKLSGGQRKRLALACALVGAPDILFLDEPTTGLDPNARQSIWDVVERLTATGKTVLLTTHYMDEAARLCDRVGVIDHGRMIALDTPTGLVRMLGAEQVIELEVQGEFPAEKVQQIAGVKRIDQRKVSWSLIVNDVSGTLPAVLKALDEDGIQMVSISTHQATLDDVFIYLTGRELRDG